MPRELGALAATGFPGGAKTPSTAREKSGCRTRGVLSMWAGWLTLLVTESCVTLDELEGQLPNGLHDAHLEKLEIDWPNERLSFEARADVGNDGTELERRLKVTVTGLVYCAIEPPQINAPGGLISTPAEGLWIQPEPLDSAPPSHPTIPPGCFLHRMVVSDWNRSIYVCACNAEFVWLEPDPSQSEGN